ncbi:MAG: D-alanyl-D-alanine carboxypeptidase/D-alanyl-D-alanine-endopeptidase [Vicinamibacterales bacterium]|nr:D-alanyl-D-alanine carboxypeptidase/D-alanyl-D-alanine-endopeptidase [Vicinamibacterales bacterium]
MPATPLSAARRVPSGEPGQILAALLAGALVLVGSAGCAVRGAPAGVPTLAEAHAHPSHAEQLRRDIRAIVTAPATNQAIWAVVVNSLQTGESLYNLNAFTFLLPASNQKLVTTAVAAERLGWRHRFETRLVAMGPIVDGRLQGDLVVVGNGDPTINPRHPERWLAFDDWARQLRKAGVRLIEGDLIGDDRAFAQPGWGMGWELEDVRLGFAAPIGALQFNENQVEITAGPGMTPGAAAIVTVGPATSGLRVANHAITGGVGTPASLRLERLPGSQIVDLYGSIPLEGAPVTVTASVENPTEAYLGALESALARNDVLVKGRALDIDTLAAPPDPAAGQTLVVDLSPPLRDIIDVTNKVSRNGYAETLLRALDQSGRPATADEGLARVRETLARWGIDPHRYMARDGSGLSRYNFLTADMLTALLTYTWIDPAIADLFFDSLPESGRSGTLERRMRGTPAEGRIRAKTGTLSHARSLSGYLRTLEGEPLVFSILVNNYRQSAAEIDQQIDAVLQRLVVYTRATPP